MTDHLPEISSILSEKFGITQDLITSQAQLRGDLNLSNIEITEAISMIAQKFTITLSEEFDVDKVTTVDDLCTLVENYSQEI